MDVDVAAEFLAGSILFGIAVVVFMITLVVVNNIIFKYWKPLGWFKTWHMIGVEPTRFASPEEAEALDKTQEPKLK
jgi:hypothetical protein